MNKIVGMQGSIAFQPLNLKKENLRNIQDTLEIFYGSGSNTVLGVPASTPFEIPRMVCQSEHNHSQIHVSCVNGQFSARFDDKFSGNFDACFDYSQKRMVLLQKALLEIGVNTSFSGIIVKYVCDNDICAIDRLREKAFVIEGNYKVFDVLSRVTYVKDDTFYVNLSMNNLRNISPKGPNKEAVGVSLDVNDRYCFNFKNDNPHNPEKSLEDIFKIHKDFANNTLDDLILRGVFEDGK